MAMVAVTLLCAGVEGFLFYLLTHFARELKKDRAVRSAVAVIPVALAGGPATIGGAWLGTRTYHALSDGNFRDVVLGLLFISGVTLTRQKLV